MKNNIYYKLEICNYANFTIMITLTFRVILLIQLGLQLRQKFIRYLFRISIKFINE